MKFFRFKNPVAVLVLLAIWLALPLLMVQTADAATWKEKNIRFAATAGETLAVGDVVCIAPADGKAYKADSNDSSLRPAVGMIGRGGASGATVEVIVSGIISGMTAKSPGARLFLSETAGALTTTGPTNAQPMGWVMPGSAGAATSTTYFIQVNIPNSAGAGY